MRDTILSTIQILIHLILITTIRLYVLLLSSCIDRKTEVQGGCVTCPWLHN